MITEIVIVALVLVLLLWDIWLYSDSKEGNSISQVVIKYSKQFPIIPFALGFLVGHWYG